MSVNVSVGYVTLVNYNLLDDMMSISMSLVEDSPSQDIDFIIGKSIFNLGQFVTDAMEKKWIVSVEHEEGQTFVENIFKAVA